MQDVRAGTLCAGGVGMRAYSTDLKERLVRAVANGQPLREAARRFGVAVNTVKRAVVQQRETGSLERRPIPGGPRRIGREQEALLLARLQEAPDATVLEHCAWWAEHQGQQVSEATMWRAMRRLGWTHKKRHWQPVSATKRRGQQFVFVDESGTHTALTRLYGWAPHDQRAVGSVPRNHGKNTTLVAALTPHGLQAPWTIEGAIDTLAFERYVKEVVGPTLRPGQVVILDNLSVHTAARIREAIEAVDCELLFLPPYSPDCTPSSRRSRRSKRSCAGWGRAPARRCLKRSARRSRPSRRTMRPPGSVMPDTPCPPHLPEGCCSGSSGN